jgi:PAS domain S-box-containing protein
MLRNLRLQTKLVATYVALALCTTTITLLGVRHVQQSAETQSYYRSDLLRRTFELAALAGSAAEDGIDYLLAGDPLERDGAVSYVATLTSRTEELVAIEGLTADERAQLSGVVDAVTLLRDAQERMFRAYERDHTVPATEHKAHQAAVDVLAARIASLREVAITQARADRARARESSQWLTIIVGSAAVLVGILAGALLGRRILAPLGALQRSVSAYGARQLVATSFPEPGGEIGELVSAFKRAAETRMRAEQRLENIFASMQDTLVVCAPDGTIVAANATCCKVSGYAERELIGRSATVLFGAGIVTATERHEEREALLTAKDGGVIAMRLSSSALRGDADVGGCVLVARDMTEQHRLEARLLQAEKMEAVGRLAGGIAHDFNNMLTIILSYSSILLEDLGPAHPAHADLQEVRSAAERSADLTRQLLAFSRQQALSKEIVDLNDAVETTVRMAKRVMGEDVDVVTSLSVVPCNAAVEPGQLAQVILNLIMNARDAMPAGGKVTVATTIVEVGENDVSLPDGAIPGPYVALTIRDTGSGMDRHTLDRIFEPFFTTKEPGKGTGLGLSTAFGIVRQCGGHMSVESQLGHGTSFKVYLPQADQPCRARGRRALSEKPKSISETVLLVEDEERVRNLVHQILIRRGYRVLAASQPDEALLMCEQYGGEIHLLFTDVIMPQMSGRELADRLLATRPNMKVLFMSGYTADVMLNHGVSTEHIAFLQKPFTPDLVGEAVRRALVPQPASLPRQRREERPSVVH